MLAAPAEGAILPALCEDGEGGGRRHQRRIGRNTYVKEIPIEEVEEEILRRLAALKRQRDAEAAIQADLMRAAGLCP